MITADLSINHFRKISFYLNSKPCLPKLAALHVTPRHFCGLPWGTSTSWCPGYRTVPPLPLLPSAHRRLPVTAVSPSPHWPRSSGPPSSPQPLPIPLPRVLWSWDTFRSPSSPPEPLTASLRSTRLSGGSRPQALSTYRLPRFFGSLCPGETPKLFLQCGRTPSPFLGSGCHHRTERRTLRPEVTQTILRALGQTPPSGGGFLL